MGLSANQAKFLAITSRKIDLEHRMQRICNNRVGLSKEIDQIADKYNKAISDRRLFTKAGDVYEAISLQNLHNENFHVLDTQTNRIIGANLITDKIIIADQAQFNSVMNDPAFDGSLDYVLLGDFDASGLAANPSRTLTGGSFDGNGYSLTNLNTMLFASADASSKIEDLHVASGSFTASGDNQGLIVGNNSGTIDNVAVGSGVSVNANGRNSIGVISGSNSGTIEKSYSQASITNANGTSIGSIAGSNNGTVTESYAGENVQITGTGSNIGGVVGSNANGAEVSNSYSLADIDITGSTSRDVGGVAGLNSGTVENVFSFGSVSGDEAVGGLIGGNQVSGTLSNSYSISAVNSTSSSTELGALVGQNNGTITSNNYSVNDYTGVSVNSNNSGTDDSKILNSIDVNWGKNPITAFNSDANWDTQTKDGNFLPNTLSGLPVSITTESKTDFVPVTQITPADVTSTGVTATISGQVFNQVRYMDATGTEVTAFVIDNADRLNALASTTEVIMDDFIIMDNGADGDGTDNTIDMSAAEWGVIDNFSGHLNGNGVVLDGLYINTLNDTATGTGFIGQLYGSVENLKLHDMSINITGSEIRYVGGVAGRLESSGSINNVEMNNLQIDITENAVGGQYPAYIAGITAYSGGGDIDRVNLTGDINIHNPNTDADNIAGVVGNLAGSLSRSHIGINITVDGNTDCMGMIDGCGSSGSITINNVAVTGSLKSGDTDDASNYVLTGSHPDLGFTSGAAGSVTDSYRTYHAGGSVTRDLANGYDLDGNGTIDSDECLDGTFTGTGADGVYGTSDDVISGADGEYDFDFTIYWDGATTGAFTSTTADNSSTSDWDSSIWDVSGGTPAIKFSAMESVEATFTKVKTMSAQNANGDFIDNPNTVSAGSPEDLAHIEYDDFTDPAYDAINLDLEEGLRTGRYELVVDADMYTQTKTLAKDDTGLDIGSVQPFERRDWKTTSIVHDDLYEANDAAAQTEYEEAVNKINAKDKKLELEQQQVETEYNAITTERDTIKKLVATNSEKSFKLFG